MDTKQIVSFVKQSKKSFRWLALGLLLVPGCAAGGNENPLDTENESASNDELVGCIKYIADPPLFAACIAGSILGGMGGGKQGKCDMMGQAQANCCQQNPDDAICKLGGTTSSSTGAGGSGAGGNGSGGSGDDSSGGCDDCFRNQGKQHPKYHRKHH
jgi:hypothetical protein